MTSITPIATECGSVSRITVLYVLDSLAAEQTNYLDRVVYQATAKNVPFLYDQRQFFECLQIENELMLADEEGFWGVYKLDREGVDQLLTELDILIVQKSYGKGISR